MVSKRKKGKEKKEKKKRKRKKERTWSFPSFNEAETTGNPIFLFFVGLNLVNYLNWFLFCFVIVGVVLVVIQN